MRNFFLLRYSAPLLTFSLMLLAIGAFSAWYVCRLQVQTSEVLDSNVAMTRAAEEFEISFRETRSHLRQFLLDGDRAHFEAVGRQQEESAAWLAEMEQSATTPANRETLRKIRAAYQRFGEELDRLRQDESAVVAPRREAVLHLLHDDLTNAVLLPAHDYLQQLEQLTRQRSQYNRSLSNRVALVMLLLGCCGAVGGLVAGFGIARGISRSMINLTVPIRDAAGRLSEVVGPVTLKAGAGFEDMQAVLHQLAEQVGRVVDQLQHSQHQVLRGEQLAAVGQLAAGLAHELRNPLTSLKVLVQTANDQGGPEHLTTKDLVVFEQEITRLEQLIQHFLDFARPPEMLRQRVDLATLLEQTVRLVSPRAEQQRVVLRTERPGEPVLLDADASQLRQVLLNLLLNALDVLREGATLAVRVRRPAADSVIIEVIDTGPGIPPGQEERIFEPFFSTKETGTGLGLAICRRIVAAHQGTIAATNRSEGGAVFTVVLPLPGGAAARGRAAEGGPNAHAASAGSR